MKKNVCKLLSGILCLVMLMGMAGCGADTPSGNTGAKNDPINIENLTNALLTKVSYDTPLEGCLPHRLPEDGVLPRPA